MTRQHLKPGIRSQISHELVTPLSGMIGLIAFLNATTLTQEQKKYLSDILLSANQLLDAQVKIDDLLLASLCSDKKL